MLSGASWQDISTPVFTPHTCLPVHGTLHGHQNGPFTMGSKVYRLNPRTCGPSVLPRPRQSCESCGETRADLGRLVTREKLSWPGPPRDLEKNVLSRVISSTRRGGHPRMVAWGKLILPDWRLCGPPGRRRRMGRTVHLGRDDLVAASLLASERFLGVASASYVSRWQGLGPQERRLGLPKRPRG